MATVEANIIYSPPSDADGRNAFRRDGCATAQAFIRSRTEQGEIPVQMPRTCYRSICHSMNKLNGRAFREPAEQRDTATLRAQINRNYRPPIGWSFHRRKASVRPPSTGTMCPVVHRASGLARNRMARAQSTGSIG